MTALCSSAEPGSSLHNIDSNCTSASETRSDGVLRRRVAQLCRSAKPDGYLHCVSNDANAFDEALTQGVLRRSMA